MSDRVACCPECGTADPEHATPGGVDPHPDAQPGRHYCLDCRAKFDECDERESGHPSPDCALKGGALALSQADPDDYPQ